MEAQVESETDKLEQQLKIQNEKVEGLNEVVKDLSSKVTKMGDAKVYLLETINEIEKVRGDLALEQRKLATKQNTIMA